MTEPNPFLFVYGSLLASEGHPMGDRLRAEATRVGPAIVRGALYRVSWYPGVVGDPDGAEAHGEVYRLADPAVSLAWLDAYEGVAQGASSVAAADEYRRVEATVVCNGAALAAWIYLYRRNPAGLERIASGRWGDRTPSAAVGPGSDIGQSAGTPSRPRLQESL